MYDVCMYIYIYVNKTVWTCIGAKAKARLPVEYGLQLSSGLRVSSRLPEELGVLAGGMGARPGSRTSGDGGFG